MGEEFTDPLWELMLLIGRGFFLLVFFFPPIKGYLRLITIDQNMRFYVPNHMPHSAAQKIQVPRSSISFDPFLFLFWPLNVPPDFIPAVYNFHTNRAHNFTNIDNRDLGITGRDPSCVSKSNRWHIDICQFSLYEIGANFIDSSEMDWQFFPKVLKRQPVHL